jgi:hypothetical protein
MAIRRLRTALRGAATVAMVCAAMVSATMVWATTTAVPAQAAGQLWNGRYTVVTYASDKVGTSIAARQSEPDFSAVFTFLSDCSSGRCIAVANGPAPSNPTIPTPQRYLWDGSRWSLTYDWQWECNRGDGGPRVYSPARSWVFYEPQSDGTLQGTWHTDIYSDACRGNVIMPIAAIPA